MLLLVRCLDWLLACVVVESPFSISASKLRFPSLNVLNKFESFGVSEALCLQSCARPKFSVAFDSYLVRGFSSLSCSFRIVSSRTLSEYTSTAAASFQHLRISGYFGYIKLVRFSVANNVCCNYPLGFEAVRSQTCVLQNLCGVALCSGDCGFYSILNLLIQYASLRSFLSKLVASPSVSAVQYLNVVLGSVLSTSLSISSFSNAVI